MTRLQELEQKNMELRAELDYYYEAFNYWSYEKKIHSMIINTLLHDESVNQENKDFINRNLKKINQAFSDLYQK